MTACCQHREIGYQRPAVAGTFVVPVMAAIWGLVGCAFWKTYFGLSRQGVSGGNQGFFSVSPRSASKVLACGLYLVRDNC